MSRPRSIHRCQDCGATSSRWVGRCPSCGEWNTLVEQVADDPTGGGMPVKLLRGRAMTSWADATSDPAGFGQASLSEALPIQEVDVSRCRPDPTGLGELDRVLGGGLVPGSSTLIGGEPGIGKSTLLLQAASTMARRGLRCVMVSAEESPAQIRGRAARIGALEANLWLLGEGSLPSIVTALDGVRPDIVAIDSIQTVWDPDVDSPPGSLAQVRACAHQLVALARVFGPAVVLVGHVTKEGGLAGPRVLEHLVDTVLSFEGDRTHGLRMLRAVKHRFGRTGEVGLMEMTESGLVAVDDAGKLLLDDRGSVGPGSVVFAALEGRRPILVEVQALVAPTVGPARRSASGVDANRLGLLLAVLDRRAGVALAHHDVYVSTVGGIRLDDPAADLAICLAIASAATDRPLAPSVVAAGEVGLSGELRRVAQMPARLAEAARLGFTRAVVPSRSDLDPAQTAVELRPASSLSQAIQAEMGEPVAAASLRLVGARS